MKVKIDVGANRGAETKEMAADGSIVYAFEPTWELITQHLWPLSFENPNIRIVPFAVDVENSFKKFNVAGFGDWGCSSLHDFAKDIHQKWPDRPDFQVTHAYVVPTITLFDFCTLYQIDEIDELHIDAQGNDLNVLKSLGSKVDIVKQGVVEAANAVNLYDNANNRIEDVRKFLTDNGFEIYSETQNDWLSAEMNVHFKRKSHD